MNARFARVYSGELDGIRARRVEVEVDMHVGLHSFSIVGLADKALAEAKERVGAALKNSGMKPPSQENRKIVVNLAPADVKKTGSQYDAAIAIGYLLATGQVRSFDAEGSVFAGELALDGSLRPIRGALSFACMAKACGMREIFVPQGNAGEAALQEGIAVLPAGSLGEIVAHLEGRVKIVPATRSALPGQGTVSVDLGDIRGQESAKRALVVGASGGHHTLMIGAPGAGKTMLAQCVAGILPPLSLEEAVELTQIYSAAGQLASSPFVALRPFRAPHHTASGPSIVGGGTIPRPGEASLAHRGVLFLDELPEFRRDVLESLREPLEGGKIAIARAKGSCVMPARFALVAAMNPCPCGNAGDAERECRCGAAEAARYRKRVSGPIMDRIDIQIRVPRVKLDDLKQAGPSGLDSASAAKMVVAARERQYARAGRLNAELSSKQCEAAVKLDASSEKFIETAWKGAMLSARGYYRILKVARTIADMEGAVAVREGHIAEAFGYRLRE